MSTNSINNFIPFAAELNLNQNNIEKHTAPPLLQLPTEILAKIAQMLARNPSEAGKNIERFGRTCVKMYCATLNEKVQKLLPCEQLRKDCGLANARQQLIKVSLRGRGATPAYQEAKSEYARAFNEAFKASYDRSISNWHQCVNASQAEIQKDCMPLEALDIMNDAEDALLEHELDIFILEIVNVFLGIDPEIIQNEMDQLVRCLLEKFPDRKRVVEKLHERFGVDPSKRIVMDNAIPTLSSLSVTERALARQKNSLECELDSLRLHDLLPQLFKAKISCKRTQKKIHPLIRSHDRRVAKSLQMEQPDYREKIIRQQNEKAGFLRLLMGHSLEARKQLEDALFARQPEQPAILPYVRDRRIAILASCPIDSLTIDKMATELNYLSKGAPGEMKKMLREFCMRMQSRKEELNLINLMPDPEPIKAADVAQEAAKIRERLKGMDDLINRARQESERTYILAKIEEMTLNGDLRAIYPGLCLNRLNCGPIEQWNTRQLADLERSFTDRILPAVSEEDEEAIREQFAQMKASLETNIAARAHYHSLLQEQDELPRKLEMLEKALQKDTQAEIACSNNQLGERLKIFLLPLDESVDQLEKLLLPHLNGQDVCDEAPPED